jgi:hypothetical protein
MHDRYVTSIDDTDDVYMKNNMCKLGQSGVQVTTSTNPHTVSRDVAKLFHVARMMVRHDSPVGPTGTGPASGVRVRVRVRVRESGFGSDPESNQVV